MKQIILKDVKDVIADRDIRIVKVMENLDVEQARLIPDGVCGVYCFWIHTGEGYIGKSEVCVGSRICHHTYESWIKKIIKSVNIYYTERASELEILMIAEFQPELNTMRYGRYLIDGSITSGLEVRCEEKIDVLNGNHKFFIPIEFRVEVEIAKRKGLSDEEINECLKRTLDSKSPMKMKYFLEIIREFLSVQKSVDELRERMNNMLIVTEKKGMVIDEKGVLDAENVKSYRLGIDSVYDIYYELPAYFEKRKTYSIVSSYGFKHILERLRGVYVGNGEFIMACLLRGIKTRIRKNDLNALIKLQTQKIWKD